MPADSDTNLDANADLQEATREAQEDAQTDSPYIERPSTTDIVRGETQLRTLAIYSSLAIFSILGALARIGLVLLATYDGQAVFPVAVAQAVGCAIMGNVVRNKQRLEQL